MNALGLKHDLVDKSSWDYLVFSSLMLSIATLSGLLFIIWTGYTQFQSFKANQRELLSNSVASVASQIADLIEERSRIITAIANDQRQLLKQIIADPDNEERIRGFEQQLRAYFPDMFAFTLANPQGERVPDDLGERIGDYCIKEMHDFLHGDQTLFQEQDGLRYYRPIVHPQPFAYHFDIMGIWNEQDQTPHVIFLSFKARLL
ncbi:MAG: hypothetical protein PVG22_15730, partial [Chromatiales bacterium]